MAPEGPKTARTARKEGRKHPQMHLGNEMGLNRDPPLAKLGPQV